MAKIWILYNLILVLLILGTSVSSAKTGLNYLFPLLLLPMVYYLAKEMLKKPRRRKLTESFTSSVGAPLAGARIMDDQVIAEEGVPLPGVSDDNRRLFLKLVGSTGLSVVIMAIFGKQSAQAAFFGSMPGPGTIAIKDSQGELIDPAEKQPTDGYTITEVDDSGATSYYGFVHKTGAWYITKEDATGSYRYAKGATLFSTNWTGRTLLSYDYFDSVF